MENPASFGVGSVSKLLHGVGKGAVHHRGGIAVFTDEPSRILIHLIKKGIATMEMFFKESIVVSSEAFIEPEVAPVLAGYQITKPLMRQFVGNQTLAGAKIFCVSCEQGAIGKRCQTGVFHASGHKIIHTNLIVFIPRVGDSDGFLEKCHHGFGVAKRMNGLIFFRRQGPEGHGNFFISVFHFDERARNQ